MLFTQSQVPNEESVESSSNLLSIPGTVNSPGHCCSLPASINNVSLVANG